MDKVQPRIAKTRTTKTTSSSMSTETRTINKPPKGAKIIRQTISTTTEQIENGWLTTKNYDGSYKLNDKDGSEYFYYTEKWYSKEDPVVVTVKDQELADVFDDEE